MNWEEKARVFLSALQGALGGAVDPRVRKVLDLLVEPWGDAEVPQRVEVTHSISPARVSLDFAHAAAGPILARMLDDSSMGQDAFLSLFAGLPEILADTDGLVGGAWTRYPANPRVPDTSLWHRASLVSALAACDGDPALLGFSLDPVRSFAWSGRSFAELGTGTWIASYLVWVGLRTVCEELGPDHVIYPCVSRQPLFRQWVGAPTSTDELAFAGLSNRIVALVPQPIAESLARCMAASIRSEWSRLASCVADRVEADRATWEGACEGTWAFAWAVTPWRTEGPGGLAAVYRGCFESNQRQLSEAVRRLPAPPRAERACEACGRPALPHGEPSCPACLTKRLLPGAELAAPLDEVLGRTLPATDDMALLVMDGDHSSGLSEGTAPGFATWGDVFHSRAGVPPEGKRWVTPGVHLFLSEALADFGLRSVPEVLGRHGGVPIYLGGDDVVALLPADRVLPAAQEIRDRFRMGFVVRGVDGRIEECPSAYRPRAGERLLAHPGKAGTTSAAVVFRPKGGPILLERARELLDDEAKERAGRDAIAVEAPQPSGGSIRWSSKWERPDGERALDRIVALAARPDEATAGSLEERAIASLLRPRSVDPGR